MGTRSRIGIVRDDGTVASIYCNWDGYPSHNGKILKQFYSDKSKIEQLLALGDISFLGECLEKNPNDKDVHPVEAYARDFGEELNEPRIDESVDAYIKSDVEEYGYLFKDGEWFVVVGYYKNRKLTKLTNKFIAKN